MSTCLYMLVALKEGSRLGSPNHKAPKWGRWTNSSRLIMSKRVPLITNLKSNFHIWRRDFRIQFFFDLIFCACRRYVYVYYILNVWIIMVTLFSGWIEGWWNCNLTSIRCFKIRCFEVRFYEAFMKIQPKRHLFFFRFFFTTFWHLFPPNPQVAMLNSTAPFPWPQGQRTTNEQPTTTNPPTPDGRVGRLEPPRWKWIIGNSPGRRNRKRPVAKPWVWRAQESAKRKGDIGGVFKFGWGKNVEWFLSFKKEKTPVIKKKHLLVGFLFEQNWWKKVMEIHGY